MSDISESILVYEKDGILLKLRILFVITLGVDLASVFQ